MTGEPLRHTAEGVTSTADKPDVTPAIVSQAIYEKTKDQLQAWGYRIFTIDHPRSIGEMQNAGELDNNVHGAGANEFRDFIPAPMEIAIDPEKPFLLESVNLSLDEQQNLLRTYAASFHDEEYPEDGIDGVRTGFLPAAIVAEVDAKYLKETGHPIITAKITRVGDPNEGEIIVFSEQWVTCGDKIGGNWIVRYGRSGTERTLTRYGDTKLRITPISSQNLEGKVPAHVLRAVVLPIPSK